MRGRRFAASRRRGPRSADDPLGGQESAERAAGGTPLAEMTPRSLVCAALVIVIAFVVPIVVAEVVSGDSARRADDAAHPLAVATALRPRDDVVEIRDFRSAAPLPDLAAERLPRAEQLPVAPQRGSSALATASFGAAEPPAQAAPSRADRSPRLYRRQPSGRVARSRPSAPRSSGGITAPSSKRRSPQTGGYAFKRE